MTVEAITAIVLPQISQFHDTVINDTVASNIVKEAVESIYPDFYMGESLTVMNDGLITLDDNVKQLACIYEITRGQVNAISDYNIIMVDNVYKLMLPAMYVEATVMYERAPYVDSTTIHAPDKQAIILKTIELILYYRLHNRLSYDRATVGTTERTTSTQDMALSAQQAKEAYESYAARNKYQRLWKLVNMPRTLANPWEEASQTEQVSLDYEKSPKVPK